MVIFIFFMTNTVGNRFHPFSLKVLFTNDYDVKKNSSPSSGYQELYQVHFCRMMFVDISDTTVPIFIYV
jgi:hypothetical protein